MNPFARMIISLLVPLLLLSSAAHAVGRDLRKEMEALLEDFRTTYGFPGATAAVVLPDGTLKVVAVGLSDVEHARPMTTNSRMLAASIGKSFWGALVLSLEAEGVLSRADRVSDHLGHLPWFSRVPNAADMTIGQLLSHAAGVPDHVHMDGVASDLIALGQAETFDPADLVGFILDQPPAFEPGSGWAYSDTGYVLLGLAVKEATGRSVFDLANERFLQPLGLHQTSPSNGPAQAGLAVGYTTEANPFDLPPRTMDDAGRLVWNPAIEWTGGGFTSTSGDLARWGQALFTGAAMDTLYLDDLLDGVSVSPDAPGILYGAGVVIYRDTPAGPVYGHGGWIPGYVSSLRHYGDHRLTIAFQINTDVGVVDDSTDLVPALEAALAELVLGREGE